MSNVSTELVRTLERLDVEYLFGYPGGRAIELLEALTESNIEVVRPRDEREASVMAETYGRLHRKDRDIPSRTADESLDCTLDRHPMSLRTSVRQYE